MNNGFIVVHRTMLDWEWYTDEKVSRLFIHCLLKANHADKKFRGKIIERGSFQTSYQMLSDETGLSVRSIRTSLNKLKTTGELTIKTSTQNTVIIINNYDEYQSIDKQNDKQKTNKRQTTDKQVTTNNNDNNDNNDNKKDKEPKTPPKTKYGDSVVMYPEEYDKLVQRYNKTIADAYIEKVDLYCGSVGRIYKDYYKTVLTWIKKDEEKNGKKIQYTWLPELKEEQERYDSQKIESKRDLEEVKDLWNKL